MNSFQGDIGGILTFVLVVCGSIAGGLVARFIVIATLKAAGRKDSSVLIKSLARHTAGPLYLLLPLIALSVSLEMIDRFPIPLEAARQAAVVLFIISIAWLLAKLTFVIEDIILARFRIDVKDNLKARKIYTQVQFFKRSVIVAIGIIAIAMILMSFSRVRQIGTALLASAGVIGIIIGFAAQRTLSTFLAGLQIAIAQPFRIDDVVVIEGEWGRIEEITLTYVVVRIWDLRRLVLPITYFLEKPFQNWTRESAHLLCTVYVYTDYTVSVEKIRQKLHRILQKSEYWDKKVWNLQVTGTNEKSIELRALMSAQDGPTAWNLRCEVREKLIEYIRTEYPDSLPRVRTDVTMIADTSAPSSGSSRGSSEQPH
ncbi:MAG: mechanosensitive ion channel [Spirochaetes bacterium]|nr:mechanosensitive ion channel [Spirochaetota bacterium]